MGFLAALGQGFVKYVLRHGLGAVTGGLPVGDLIQEVNRRPVRNVPDFAAAVQQSGTRPALLLVKRRNAVTFLTLRPGS